MRLHRLLGEVPACPVCEDQPCTHDLRRGSYRIGDRMPDHPLAHTPDEDVYEDGQLVYHAGRKMPWSEAVRLGVVKVPKPPKVKKGRRMKRPTEDRMHRPAEDRS